MKMFGLLIYDIDGEEYKAKCEIKEGINLNTTIKKNAEDLQRCHEIVKGKKVKHTILKTFVVYNKKKERDAAAKMLWLF